MQYLLATKFTTNAAGELFYAFSVANLVILMIRYLSGESEKRQKLKIVSATIQGLLLVNEEIYLGICDGCSHFGSAVCERADQWQVCYCYYDVCSREYD